MTRKDLGADCISRAELLKAMDTWDKFGYTETGCFVREPKGDYVPYVHYEDMVNCVKDLPSVTPQEPKIKVLDRDEAIKKLGAVDVYKASAWITLLKDLEYLGLKICEVEE